MPIPQPQGVLSGVKSSRGTVADLPVIVDETGPLGLLGNPGGQGGSVSIPGPQLIHYQIHR